MPTDADDEDALDFVLLAQVSPAQWDTITLYGAYGIRHELVEVCSR